jgi:tetratricopeptide (TPR) repeat protein
MNSPTASHIPKAFFTLFFIAALILTPNFVRAQEQQQSDEEKDYKLLQDTQAEKDPAQKADTAIKFLKEKPKSTYRSYFITEVQKGIEAFVKENKWSQVISVGERFISVVPDDVYTVKAMAAAYGATKNMKGFATFGEKAYAATPSGALAFQIAKAYQSIGNDAKYLQWAEKALASDSDNIDLLTDMVRRTLAQQNYAQSSKYAKSCLKALASAKKPETTDAQAWKTSTDMSYAISYAAIGATAFQSQNYVEAIKNLDSAVKYYKKMDMAYYFLGMSYWQTNKLAPAELNFAKAYVIKGSVSASAKKQLDTLWSQTHGGKLTGLQSVVDRAMQDLK